MGKNSEILEKTASPGLLTTGLNAFKKKLHLFIKSQHNLNFFILCDVTPKKWGKRIKEKEKKNLSIGKHGLLYVRRFFFPK